MKKITKFETKIMKQKIDEDFLSKHTRIRNALKRANIETYQDLYKRAKQKYNLYYITYLGKKSIQEIQKHLNEKGMSLPNYEKNLKPE